MSAFNAERNPVKTTFYHFIIAGKLQRSFAARSHVGNKKKLIEVKPYINYETNTPKFAARFCSCLI